MTRAELPYFPTRYFESRYFTPPNLTPLNLDLSHLDGGGATPAQFYGRTHDDREVYCRYRNGYLSVTVANEPRSDALKDGTVLLEKRIGPSLDGAMSLRQLCEVAGITINGDTPPPPTPSNLRQYAGEDFSGATSFYSVYLDSTLSTQKHLIEGIMRELRDAVIVQGVERGSNSYSFQECTSSDQVSETDIFILFGGEKYVGSTQTSDTTKLSNLFDIPWIRFQTAGFRYLLHPYYNFLKNRPEIARTHTVAGQSSECLHGTIHCYASFPTSNTVSQEMIGRFDNLLNKYFPRHRVWSLDIESGEPVSIVELNQNDSLPEYISHYDPLIVKWVQEKPNRWLHVWPVQSNGRDRFIGQLLERV